VYFSALGLRVERVIALILGRVLPAGGTRSREGVNWLAAVLLSATLVCLLLPLSLGPDMGWLSPTTILLFVGVVVFAALWVVVEVRAASPLIDMRVFRLRPVWTANLASLLFGVVLYSAMGFIPSFLQVPTSTGYGLGASVTLSGVLFVPITVVMLITGLLAGTLTKVLRAKTVLILGAIPPIVSFTLLAFVHAEAWEVVIATAIGGAGVLSLIACLLIPTKTEPANNGSEQPTLFERTTATSRCAAAGT
jgi:hypothetical protein